MRNYLVIGNWKMNGSKLQVSSLMQALLTDLSDISPNVECVVCPPSIYLDQVQQIIKSSNILLGVQNSTSSANSSFTGEISPFMLGDFACKYVIIGHSERRQQLHETDELVADKFQIVVDAGLQPILCVGETREEMETEQGFAVVARQLQIVIAKVGIAAFKNAVIAYEPVWAIGTGLTATPEQAQAMHQQIRAQLSDLDSEIARQIKIIYGGSVNGSNAEGLFQQEDIDGGLIGGASLKAQDFSDICHAAMSMASL